MSFSFLIGNEKDKCCEKWSLGKWLRIRTCIIRAIKKNRCVHEEKRGKADKRIHGSCPHFSNGKPYPKHHLTITISERKATLKNIIEA